MPEELETQVEQQFDEPVEQQDAPEEITPDSTQETPADPAAPSYEIDGHQLSEQQMRAALGFTQWTEQNPDKFQKLVEWERAGYDASVFTPPAPEPEEIDVYSEDYLKGLNDRFKALEAEVSGRQRKEGEAAVAEGIQRFMSQHADLDQAEAEQVFKWVHDRQVLRSIPEDLPASRVVGEVAQRFEEGYRNVFFDRAKSAATTQIVNDQAKRRRAASSSSSASSAPRSQTPNTPEERKSWMLDTIKEALAES